MKRRVVITSAGIISPIGNDVNTFIDNIKNGVCGIDKITLFDNSSFKTKLAAEVKNFNPKEQGVDNPKKKDRYLQFAIAAASQVIEKSGFKVSDENQFNTGVVVGSGIGGLSSIQEEYGKFLSRGPKKISSHFIPKTIANMAAGQISISTGARGVCSAEVTACATGTDCIGRAYRLIKDGYQDAIFAGGSEASICEIGIGGFESMGALSFSEDVNRASIPFDSGRSGFVMGEGSCILLIESLESAKRRGADIICEIAGYGQSSDAYHITAPNSDCLGILNAMKMAVKEAGIEKEKIDYINAHGTSTKLNDEIETESIKKYFEGHSQKLSVSSSKSMTGHMLGATGAVEVLVCAYALKEGFIPPTINYRDIDEKCDLDYVTEGTRNKDIEYAMSNSLGFGGHNSSIVLKKYAE